MHAPPVHTLSTVLPTLLAACSSARSASEPPATAGSVLERNVDVRMRDDVELRADLLRPARPGPFPTLVYRTPYDKEQERREHTTFAHALARGHALVVQDVRGRYASEGEFRPYQQEGQDGYDTIEWAAAQPWSNGAIGTVGLSYAGAAPVNHHDAPGAHDYRELALRNDLLTFDSMPLTAETEVIGPIEAKVFVSCTCRDLDLWVRLFDVAPDGTAFNLASPGPDVVRASYRDKTKGRQLLRPGQIYDINLQGPVTSNQFKAGHRMRAQLSGSFYPDFSRHLQSGASEVTATNFRKATIRIHHDPMHASHIVLPIATKP